MKFSGKALFGGLWRFLLLTIVASAAMVAPCQAGEILKMSTTTSLQDNGLLDVLLPAFKKETGIEVKAIARGTGAAILDGRDGNVDMIFVHARELEEQFIADGYGLKRCPVMYNDFVVVGPQNDPAKINGLKDCVEAFRRLASCSAALFVSRGDESGTHFLEKKLWQEAQAKMPDHRYLSVGQGMARTLLVAFEKQAYTLVDSATYLNLNQGDDLKGRLEIYCDSDKRLHNIYTLIAVNPKAHPHVNAAAAEKFIKWIQSEAVMAVILGFKIAGTQVFFPVTAD
ncbi:MAG: substrate-binding domain-containing protein [Candidatus Riflebacteria bacterium]|nr:substrate-binding domain-containing protein [Candidatus Riflebacteria bacterium]